MVTRSRLTCLALVLLSMALVGWIRLFPQSLVTLDDRAERIARRELQERLSGEAPARVPPARRLAHADGLTDRWIERHPAEFTAKKAAVAQRLRSELTYTGQDGRPYVYLGDFDSYLWLRHARNLLGTGTPCDAVVGGVCRDTYTNAPVGARSIYARTLHVVAIAGLHDIITFWRPAHPLPASSFLVAVIAGVLGVLPAFFVARSLAGATAGLFAGLLTAIHPIVLNRTIGSDNDVWNVVLPLCMVWALMGALGAPDSRRAALWAGLAGVAVGLQAWAWRGWLFSYSVSLAGLVLAALAHAVRYGIRRRTARIWHAPDPRRSALALVIFYVIAGAAVSVAGSDEPYFAIPAKAVAALIGRVAGNTAPSGEVVSDWPSALSRVAELKPLRLAGIVSAIGGVPVFLLGLVGLLLLLLPADRWQWRHRAVLVMGALVYGYALIGIEPSVATMLALLTLPLVAALILGSGTGEGWPIVHLTGAFIVILWFLAALVSAHGGPRFLLLLAPPFGIACGVVAGRFVSWIRGVTDVMPRGYRAVGVTVLTAVIVLGLLHPLEWGYAAARSYTPLLHGAWWQSLTRLRDSAASDAIVHTWWDYGHWVTYVAERRVSNDGTSLSTHIPHWVSRALVAPDEAPSVGILRMLSCGSDATPLPEGAQGAYGKLRASGRDPVAAYAILSDLVTLDEGAAAAYLAQHGFTPSERVEILRSTHCDPPEGYLLLGSALTSIRWSWMSFGLWDPRLGQRALPGEVPSDDETRSRADVRESSLLISVRPASGALPWVPFSPRWLPCRASTDGHAMSCQIGMAIELGRPVLEAFTYRSASPQDGRLHTRERRAGAPTEGAPAMVLLAGARQMTPVRTASPTYPDLAVLVDVPAARILVGAPDLLRSTYVHLMYLDGRYATHYRKADERADTRGRVLTWKIEWKAK
jgi:hypothetical protein